MPGTTTNESLLEWVDSWAKVLTPDSIHWCDGSQEEYDELAASMVEQGTLIPLNEAKRPNSFLARSDPGDVARVEDRTFICTDDPAEAGNNNNWREPESMRTEMSDLFRGSMVGRTMFVVPFSMAGAVLALWLSGGSFNLYSNIGLITLVGLVSKHGILITQFANENFGGDPRSTPGKFHSLRVQD